MSRLLVIIVTYNGMNWIERCLTSIKDSSMNADIFVVDNGSSDGTIDFLKSWKGITQLIISKDNLGFGKANNLGLKYALNNDYDYAYLLNQDAWVDSDVLETLIGIQAQNKGYGILSPLQLNRDKSRLDRNFIDCCPKAMISDALCNRLESLYETRTVMAAHWLVSKECLITTGFFSPTFPHYGEDDNYIQRAKYHNFKIGIVPIVKGTHDRESRPYDLSKSQYYFYIQNLIILSNPVLTKRILRVIKNYIVMLLTHRAEFDKRYLIKLIKNLKKIRNNRLQSLSTQAFMSEH